MRVINRVKKVHEVLRFREGREFSGELVSYKPEEGWRVVEEYWLLEPFCKAYIIYNDETLDYKYVVVEPELNEFELELLRWIKEELISYLESFEGTGERKEVVKSATDKLLKDLRVKLSDESYFKLEDVSCNGYNKPVFIFHRDYTNLETNVVFGEDKLDALVLRIAQISGKHTSIAKPMVDAALPDGSRIQMTLGREVSDHSSTFTIRKFRDEPITPIIDLIAWGTFSRWLTFGYV